MRGVRRHPSIVSVFAISKDELVDAAAFCDGVPFAPVLVRCPHAE